MTTAIIIIALIVIAVLAVKSYTKKLAKGCCGGGKDNEIRMGSQINKSDCPYCYKIVIGGMKCANCSVRIENSFNRQSGVSAEVSLDDKTATVCSMSPISELMLRKTVIDLGYSVEGVANVSGKME